MMKKWCRKSLDLFNKIKKKKRKKHKEKMVYRKSLGLCKDFV